MNNQSDDEKRAAKREHRKHFWKIQGLSFLGGLGGIPLVKHPDERVAATTQLWAARGGAFMGIALGIDIIVRTFVLRQNLLLCWDICLIWMVNVYLVSIGLMRSGVAPVDAVGKWSWRTSGLIALIVVLEVPALLWLMGMVHSLKTYIVMTVLGAVGAFVMLIVMRGIYSIWERKALGSGSEEE